jgi:hypothetical protein
LQRSSVFHWFAAVFPKIPQDDASKLFLPLILSTLYRVEKDETLKGPESGVFFLIFRYD